MAGRIRTIKPEILEDARSAALSSDVWRLWVSLWVLADDFGNLRGEPPRIAAEIFWAIAGPPPVAEMLEELRAIGFIELYMVRGQRYIHLHNWEKHQRIDNAGKPRVPGPAEADREDANLGGSRAISASRGESPRTSATRGSDLDLDLDPDPEGDLKPPASASPSPAADQQIALAVQEPPKRAGPSQPEVIAVVEAYQRQWVETRRPEDGKPPKLSKADFAQARALLRDHGSEQSSAILERFLADADPWLVKQGHPLRLITSRINAYRARASPRARMSKFEEAIPHFSQTREVDL